MECKMFQHTIHTYAVIHNTYGKQVMEALIVESNKMINTPFVIIRCSNYDMKLMIKVENLNYIIIIVEIKQTFYDSNSE